MADRSFLWGGENPPRRATEQGGRRRHDQQRLLVELELDDSLYQGTVRAGIGQNVPLQADGVSGRRTTFAADTSHRRQFQPSYRQELADPRPRMQSQTPRDSGPKRVTERQMQQLHARRLSSPYKLKQQVQGSRSDPRRGTSRSPSMHQSPAQLVIESIRQNIHLRDQVLAHLQQELMGVLPLHRASHVEKNVPQRVVKLLNRLRSLSLSVVEAVVYLNSEIGDSGADVEHEILEREFYGYLLQMASSDTDFLACCPPLQRFFEDFEVNLTRNPFVDGLSMDSSEVLLCSCHRIASSDRLFCSASLSSSALLRLLTHKLDEFGLQTQRYLQGWQILPAERVAAALLHLTDLETRFHALRTLPRYLQSHGDSRRFIPQQLGHQQRAVNDVAYGYGTFEDETIHQLDRQDSDASLTGDDQSRSQIPVMQAWTGSPVLKAAAEDRPPSSKSTELLPPKRSNEAARRLSKKEEIAQSPTPLSTSRTQASAPAAAGTWSSNPISCGAQPFHLASSSSSSLTADAGPRGNGEVDAVNLTPLVLQLPMLDTAAIAKSSSRSSQSERSASKKRGRAASETSGGRSNYVDVGIQMTERSSPTNQKQELLTSRNSARNHSARSMRDEAIQACEEESSNVETQQKLFIPAVTRQDLAPDTPPTPEADILSSPKQHEQDGNVNPEDAMFLSESESATRPSAFEAQSVTPVINGEANHSIAEAPMQMVSSIEAGDNTLDNDDAYECDFEYSSNEALSSIAMALQMLPSFSFSTLESTDEVLRPEEAIPPNEIARVELTGAEEHEVDLVDMAAVPTVVATTLSAVVSPAPTRQSTQREIAISLENAIDELESVEQRAEPLVSEDDEYAYSSSTAVSNIAMALSLLPNVCREDALSGTGKQSEPWAFENLDSSTTISYCSVEDDQSQEKPLSSGRSAIQMEGSVAFTAPDSPRNEISWGMNDEAEYSADTSSHSYGPAITSSRRSSNSMVTVEQRRRSSAASSYREVSVRAGDQTIRALPTSFQSNNSATTSYQGDDESEPDEFNRIFALCRDIQGTAFDMSHWVSQREVEDHIQSAAQPFSALMGYSLPTAANGPKYLERELKMLRRNFTNWKTACAEQKRAKMVVRRLVARRKVRQFVLYHHKRHVQARIDEETRLRARVASRIQHNWRVYRHKQQVSQRQTVFRVVHMAFRRTVFFVGITRRRRRWECAKEKLVRWWRRQRLRIKKKRQRQEKIAWERQRRSRALKEIQRFLNEILLRRKLKAAQEMAKNILFKEQLKWTKAKRDIERSMKLNSKHRRELIADMNARLADIDRRWQTSEQERVQLLTHHERVVQQQQRAGKVRRRRLAALKLQMFFRALLLHKKLQRVESEKNQCEIKLREELLAKEQLDVKAQKRIGQTRTQVRVLERKLGRMAHEALEAEVLHQRTVQDHQVREKSAQERAARQRIKALLDAKVLTRRAESERRKLQLEQALLLTEKREVELMSTEEQLEQRRTAQSTAADLRQRLTELEERSEALLVARNQLVAEKKQEALEAAAALERTRVKAGMQQIASWVSGKMQLSKLKKEKAAIRASAAQALEDEKRKQRKEIEAKMREVTSIKTSSYMQQRLSQHRSQKTVEMLRIQQQQKTAQEKAMAERTRAQLVQMIIDVKLLTERESERGIARGLGGVAWAYKTLQHKFMRLRHLRRMNCARRIQRTWRRWVYRQRIKRAQELAFVQFEEAKHRQALARRLQTWWRWWGHEQQRRREQQRVFGAHLQEIQARSNVRKIQGVWRRWVQREHERRYQQLLVVESHLDTIRQRANVRKIQGGWRRWAQRERERRQRQQQVVEIHLEVIRVRANVRKIQGVWRRWVLLERERRRQQQLARDDLLNSIRIRANARKIQGIWRRWVSRKQEQRESQRLVFSSAFRIQRWWRKWQQKQRDEADRIRVLRNAKAQVIQHKWKRWHQWKQAQQQKKRLQARRETCVRMLQKVWRQWREWKCTRDESAKRIQGRWEKRQQEKKEAERVRKAQFLAATRIRKQWFRWKCKEKAERKRQEEEERAIALRTQQNWTDKQRVQRSKEEGERKKRLEEKQRVSASLLQRAWKNWHEPRTKLEAERLDRQQNASALTVQWFWRKQHKKLVLHRENEQAPRIQTASSSKVLRNSGVQQHQRKMEKARIQHEQHMSALKIQAAWLKWHHEQQEEQERERMRREQYESSLKIQRNWWISQRRRKVNQERIRHKQNMKALKIQKRWRRWRRVRLEQRTRIRNNATQPQKSRAHSTAQRQDVSAPKPQQLQQERQQTLESIQRSYGRCIVRAMKRFHWVCKEEDAATKIQAIWKGKLYRMRFLQALEMKRAEETRQYRLMVSVSATKVQVCWRRWHLGIRQEKRSIVQDEELGLIQEAKALEREVLMAKRASAARRIQRAFAFRTRVIDTKGASHGEVTEYKVEEPVDNTINEELSDFVEPIQEDLSRDAVARTVDDWSHRELPHILTRSVNQILFYRDAANVLQKFVRGYQRRQQTQFYPQHSLGDSSSPDVDLLSFHFYFKRASAWLDLDRSRAATSGGTKPLRLRFDPQITRRLLRLFEPSEEFGVSEIQQALDEIVTDALPLLQSSVCQEDNENPRPELRYHDVEEMTLPHSVKLLRHLSQRRARIRRQQLVEVATNVETAPLSPIATSVSSSPLGKKEVTIFTAVESASIEDATFLQQRGADLAVLEPKTQRNALHVLSFCKENYRSRADMLDFLLRCGASLDVNAVDCNGDTPLMLYAALGHLEFMQTLMQHGADVQKTNRRGQTVLHRACEEDQVEICGFLQQLMLKDSAAENLLPIETIAALAPQALPLHKPDSVGRYPLHYLAEKGFVECAKQLVVPTEANYDWNRTLQAQGDCEGRTALHLAVLAHDAAMTAFLLTPGGGADANAFDELHRSPLHYAVESPAALPIVSRLVQHGANVNVADERGDTPLHWTAFSGRAAVAQNLLALGADPTLANSDWETPAQIAAAYGQLDCMRLLLLAQRRYGAETKEQQALIRPASEKTALQRLEEAVKLRQAAQSTHALAQDDSDANREATAGAEQPHGGYWEELHQDVQLVEESGQFSSEGEED